MPRVWTVVWNRFKGTHTFDYRLLLSFMIELIPNSPRSYPNPTPKKGNPRAFNSRAFLHVSFLNVLIAEVTLESQLNVIAGKTIAITDYILVV